MKIYKIIFVPLLLLITNVLAQESAVKPASQLPIPQVDSAKPASQLSKSQVDSAKPVSQLSKSQVDSAKPVSQSPKSQADSIKHSGKVPSVSNDSTNLTFKSGSYFGFGAGVALGNLPVIDLWKNSLCSTLESCHLTDSSFSTTDDKSKLKFSTLQNPDAYNLGFPLSIDFSHFNENSFFSTAVSFFMINKQSKSSITVLNDSSGRKIELKQALLFYSFSLDFDLGTSIPQQYFSIDGVDKSFFTAGFGISPIVSIKTSHIISSNNTDSRMQNVKNSVSSTLNDVGTYGTSFTFRAGLTTIHRLRRGALQTGLLYSFNWFDYFRKSGHFTNINDIYSGASDGNHRLAFLSNRLELQFTFLHVKS